MADQADTGADREDFRRTVRELRGFLELHGRLTGQLRTGMSVTVINNQWTKLDGKDEAEALRRVGLGRLVDDMTPEEEMRSAIKVVRAHLDDNPEEWERVRKQLEP